MKTKILIKKIALTAMTLITAFCLLACGMSPNDSDYWYGANDIFSDADEFTEFIENDFINASEQPTSYFSMDVSTASYSVLRKYISQGLTINKDMVKIEEMVNYFRYSYPTPAAGEPLSMSGSLFPCTWNEESLLFSIGIKAKEIEFESIRNNLVFLIDTSGSMDAPDKLGLLQQAFCILADNLNDDDVVSIVTYAGSSSVALDGAGGFERNRIKNIISDLTASGSTGGEDGIRQAYELAEQHFIEGGNNRVILATDGDFNVGISTQNELKSFISQKRTQSKGVYLSVMGFGLGNLKNNTMDTLAQNGNGTAYYIDSPLQAKKVMAQEMMGTLVTVADDVKASVEFNPDKVESYRLLGYETKLLSQQDWENSAADAGEIGAGHTVTAIYEIKLSENYADISTHETLNNNFCKASIRYKEPYAGERPSTDDRQVKELSKSFDLAQKLSDSEFLANEDLVFISAVVESALIFRDSAYKADASIASVIDRLELLQSVETDEYRADFLQLVKQYQSIY